jgi:hypothetical protein
MRYGPVGRRAPSPGTTLLMSDSPVVTILRQPGAQALAIRTVEAITGRRIGRNILSGYATGARPSPDAAPSLQRAATFRKPPSESAGKAPGNP